MGKLEKVMDKSFAAHQMRISHSMIFGAYCFILVSMNEFAVVITFIERKGLRKR